MGRTYPGSLSSVWGRHRRWTPRTSLCKCRVVFGSDKNQLIFGTRIFIFENLGSLLTWCFTWVCKECTGPCNTEAVVCFKLVLVIKFWCRFISLLWMIQHASSTCKLRRFYFFTIIMFNSIINVYIFILLYHF